MNETVTDASDAVDLADEIAARFRTLQQQEEAVHVNRAAYLENLDELRTLIDAIQAYALMPAPLLVDKAAA
jgi:trans-aconitate methyltransferase